MTQQELTVKIEELDELLKSGSNFLEAEQGARELCALYELAENKFLYGRSLLILSESLWQRGLTQDALPLGQEVLNISRQISNVMLELNALENLGSIYCFKSENSAAMESFQNALTLAEKHNNKKHIASCTGNIGLIYSVLSDYQNALEYYKKTLKIFEDLDNKKSTAIILSNIGAIYTELSDYDRAIEYYNKALNYGEIIDDKRLVMVAASSIGIVYCSLNDYNKASNYYLKSLTIAEDLADKRNIAHNIGNLGLVFMYLDDYSKALIYILKSIELAEDIGYRDGLVNNFIRVGDAYYRLFDYKKALEYLHKALNMAVNQGVKSMECRCHLKLFTIYEKLEQWQEYAFHLKRYYELDKEIYNEETKKKAQLFDIERKEAEREKQLAVERAKAQATEELLHNTLPPSIADRLLAGERIADHHADVSVVFADIVDFTRLSQNITAEELVKGLDLLFTTFDDIAEKYGLEKIKTIGDCYMAIAGAPIANENHAEVAALMAVEMIEAASKFRAIATGEPIQLRIGLHSGAAVAGVIGRRKYAYDLWGDAVNTASRMESYGVAGRIHCSEGFIEKLGENGNFKSSLRGEIEIKGKGVMNTYFLEKL